MIQFIVVSLKLILLLVMVVVIYGSFHLNLIYLPIEKNVPLYFKSTLWNCYYYYSQSRTRTATFRSNKIFKGQR